MHLVIWYPKWIACCDSQQVVVNPFPSESDLFFCGLEVLWFLNLSTSQLTICLNYHSHCNDISKMLSMLHVS
jgi:hypothetical protein